MFVTVWSVSSQASETNNWMTSLLSERVGGDDFTLSYFICPGDVFPFPLMMGLLRGPRS